MSLLITSVIVASGVLLGRFIARGTKSNDPTPDTPSDDAPDADNERNEPKRDAPAKEPMQDQRDPFEDFPCHLGDVLMRSGGDEAWLAGALLFSESRPVAVLFVAPEAGKDVAIYVRPRPTETLAWLLPVDAGELAVGPEPPTSIEHLGVRFERQRRLPLRAKRMGTGAPDVGQDVIVAEYTSTGTERLVIVASAGATRAWRGTELEEGMYEVIPSGKSTLDEE